MYISLYVDVNTFLGGRQPQNKLMRLRTFKKGLEGRGASFARTAQMSMESDSLLCHRQRGVICLCDLRPCLAGHEKNGMLLHQSPYLPTCKAKANEGVFVAEEPSQTPRIIRFSV